MGEMTPDLTDIPEDQRLLFHELCQKLVPLDDEVGLIRFMGGVLRSLLRRKGDTQFLDAIQDAFIAGIAGVPLVDQKKLAREIIRLVIVVRPEIARAWQAATQAREAETAAGRRATDHPPPPPKAATDHDVPPPAEVETHPRSEMERVVITHLKADIARRMALFQVPASRFPSVGYSHEQPFFLFSPAFAKVLADFITDDLFDLCHGPLGEQILRPLLPILSVRHEEGAIFLAEKDGDIRAILAERLNRLAGRQASAEAKIDAEQKAHGGKGNWKTVEVPVSLPRVIRVLGVNVPMGTTVAKRKVRVRIGKHSDIEPAEMEALVVITRLRDMAAAVGISLPASCDLRFLATLMTFDTQRFAQAVREFQNLVGNSETSRRFLFERLDAMVKVLPDAMIDVLVMMLFWQYGDSGFGFQELYDVCLGTARATSGQAGRRDLLLPEIARRPRELAFQIRDVLKRRADESVLHTACQMLFKVWRVMSKTRFAAERHAALTVFSSFPVIFAEDPEEGHLAEVGHVLERVLTAPLPDYDHALVEVNQAYRPAAQRYRKANVR